MKGVKIGHFTNLKDGTGLSVFLFESGATGSYWISGSAPATHELAVLDTDSSVPELYGLVLSGGSAYGLYAAQGVMQYLTEQGIGHATRHGNVPIVPAAAIYDLAHKTPHIPQAQDAYHACKNASEMNQDRGRIGAGTGATIGKLIPHANAMTGGLGYATLTLENGIEVTAYVVVNCVGDVRDEAGNIVAGARHEQDGFADCQNYLLSGEAEHDLFAHANTTLALVCTNAKFDKAALRRLAKMATAGMARAITPIFTRYDGDILFCVSCGEKEASELTIGTLAAKAVQLAILDAVKESEVE